MTKLLEEYVSVLLRELSSVSQEKRDLESKLLQTALSSPEFGSWKKGQPKYGEVRLAPAALVPANVDYVKFFDSAGYPVVEKSENSVSGIFDTWDVTTPSGNTVQVVFASRAVPLGGAPKNKLVSASVLGFASEHAVYAAMNGIGPAALQRNIENDSRISPALRISSPEDIAKFFADCNSMQAAAKSKLSEMGITARADEVPSAGTDEHDLTSTSGEEKYFVHVKYQSDRLVGIPKPAGQTKEDAAKNPSVIYKDARDSLLFTGGLSGGKGTIDVVKDELLPQFLTPYGKMVLAAQRDLGESEIAAIIKNPALKEVLYSELKKRGFNQNISDAIKQQLGLETKGDTVAKTLFIKFNSPTEVKTRLFVPGQGRNIGLSLRPGNLTSEAFVVDATFVPPGDPKNKKTITDVFYIELGSIKRAKYVQLHKGKNFDEFSKQLDLVTS